MGFFALNGALLEEERALQAKWSSLQAYLIAEEEQKEDDPVDLGELRRELADAQTAYSDLLARFRKENK